MELTASNVRPCSRSTLAPADTSRLLTCNAAAMPDWLTPPFASNMRILLFLDIGIKPLSMEARPGLGVHHGILGSMPAVPNDLTCSTRLAD